MYNCILKCVKKGFVLVDRNFRFLVERFEL